MAAVKNGDKTWFAGIVSSDPTDKTKVLAFETWFDWKRQPERKQIKLPGGTKKTRDDGRIDRSVRDTLIREFLEEVVKNRKGTAGKHRLIHMQTLPPVVGRPVHEQHFFIVEGWKGELRLEDLFEQEDGKAEQTPGEREPREEKTGPPTYWSIVDLAKVIIRSHAPALWKYCQMIALENADLAMTAAQAMKELEARGIGSNV